MGPKTRLNCYPGQSLPRLVPKILQFSGIVVVFDDGLGRRLGPSLISKAEPVK